MQNILLSKLVTNNPKFKQYAGYLLALATPFMVIGALVLGSIYELFYWKNILWLLVY